MQIYKDTFKQEQSLSITMAASIAIFIAMIIFMYPGDEAAVDQLTGLSEMGDWEAAFGITSAPGAEFRLWLAFLAFSYVGIIYLTIPAISGTKVFARDVDTKTLDILLANPVSRRRVLIEKTAAILSLCFLSIFFLFVVIYLLALTIHQNVNLIILFSACMQIFALTLFVTILSIFFAIYFRDLTKARQYVAVIVLGSYIIGMIVMFVEELEFLKYFEIFYYYDSSSTILKPNFESINWDKSIYLVVFSVLLFIITYVRNERFDMIPHYSIQSDRVSHKQDSGLPFPLFFVSRFQQKYPCLVEQIRSDKTIFYIFAFLVSFSGIITPGMYPGDTAWPGLTGTYKGVMTDGIVHGHGIALNFSGYYATEGLGESFLVIGILAVILGTKIVVREQKTKTSDMLFAQSTPVDSVLKQRMVAIALEYVMIFTLMYIATIIGILLSGYGIDYIPAIGLTLYLTCLIGLFMTYLITMISVYITNPGKTSGVAALVYYGTYIIFSVCYTMESLRFLSKVTPFYWGDRVGILYNKGLRWIDLGITLIYLALIFIFNAVSLRKIKDREFNF